MCKNTISIPRLKKFFFIQIIGIIIFLMFLVPNAFAMPTIEWQINNSSTESIDYEAINVGGGATLSIFVNDTDKSGSGTINVSVNSSAGSTNIRLLEGNPGEFRADVIPTPDNYRFNSDATIIVEIEDDDFANNGDFNEMIVDNGCGSICGIFVISEMGTNIFIEKLTEDEDSGIFEATIKFSTTINDDSKDILQVSEGGFVAFFDDETGAVTQAIITPIPEGKGSFVAQFGERISATYTGGTNAVTDTFDLLDSDIGGRSSTSSVKPSLKSGGEASLVGRGCRGDCTPPTLGVYHQGKRIVDNGFSYNDNPKNVEYFYTPYPLITVNVGEENVTVLKIYEDQGPQNIKHVELAFGLGKGEIIGNSKAVIEWDKKFDGIETVNVFDPEKALQDVRVESKVGKCGTSVSDARCLIVTIYHTFREPLDFNMVGTHVWDLRRNGWQNYYNHGIEIIGESMNPPEKYDGIYKGHKHMLTETGKTTAVDEQGNTWSLLKDIWMIDYIPTKKIDDGVTMHGFDRNNARFEMYKQGQVLLAENTLNNEVLLGKQVVNEQYYDISVYHTIEYPDRVQRSEDLELQENIILEKKRAQETFEKIPRN